MTKTHHDIQLIADLPNFSDTVLNWFRESLELAQAEGDHNPIIRFGLARIDDILLRRNEQAMSDIYRQAGA